MKVIARIICRFKGHDWPEYTVEDYHAFRPCLCNRCGEAADYGIIDRIMPTDANSANDRYRR